MPDDLKKAPEDRPRISVTEPGQAKYWADKFRVSEERLSEAVRKVGFSPEAVGRELMRVVSKNRDGGPGRKRRAF